MPCYDKKLEAARDDLQVPGSDGVAEVDCCITSGELQQLLEQRQVRSLGPAELLCVLWCGVFWCRERACVVRWVQLLRAAAAGSGGERRGAAMRVSASRASCSRAGAWGWQGPAGGAGRACQAPCMWL